MRGFGPIVAVFAGSLFATVATAQRPIAVEAGVFVQHTLMDDELELDNPTGIGGRIALFILLRNLSVEADIQFASTDWSAAGGSRSVTYRPVGYRLVYGIPLAEKTQLLLGAGYQLNVYEGRTRQIGSSVAGNEYEDAFAALVGLKRCLNDQWSLRFDVPIDHNPHPNFNGSTTDLDGKSTSFGLRLGVNRMLKGLCYGAPVVPPPPPPPAQPAPPPAPAPPPPPPNAAPVAAITSPAAGASLTGPVAFTATCRDPEQGDVVASGRWRSDRDGDLGTGASINRQLSAGTHTITFTCSDGAGLAGTASVNVTAQELLVRLNWIYFDFNRSSLTSAGRDTLDGIVQTLNQRADLRLAVEGHADPFGSAEYNDALAARRAQAVVDYLVRGGVSPQRIASKSFGEQCLLLEDDRERPQRPVSEHRANRRVEIWSVGNLGVAANCR
jgi:peptidoglycan-associated lipoprotein